MASLPPSDCCARGFKHSGESVGSIVNFNGIESYVTGSEENASKKLLYFFTDVIGHKFINAQLIADQFAAKGYYVIVPDLFNGDPVKLNPPAGFDLMNDWLPNHPIDVVQPIIDTIVEGVKQKFGQPKFAAAVGYCFGAKPAVRLLSTDAINAVSVFHPSFVEISEVEAIKGGLLINAPDDDFLYTAELRHATEETLKKLGKEKNIQYRQVLYSSIGHGFAVRGDISIPMVKYAKEKAFFDTVDWFEYIESGISA